MSEPTNGNKNGQTVKVLTAAEIFGVSDIPVEFVSVPEWSGGDHSVGIYIRGMSGHERDKFETSLFKVNGKNRSLDMSDMRARLVAACAVDGPDPETSSRIFTPAQVSKLSQKSAAALDRLFSVAQKLSGISDKDVDELVGNFTLGTTVDSGSG